MNQTIKPLKPVEKIAEKAFNHFSDIKYKSLDNNTKLDVEIATISYLQKLESIRNKYMRIKRD